MSKKFDGAYGYREEQGYETNTTFAVQFCIRLPSITRKCSFSEALPLLGIGSWRVGRANFVSA